ncbi:GLPGLI family protein [Riemerella columbina]|uniref:GLPGLI family protein n=1 Tax=Riemerella columbina TaxID=103810 RepID=UPI00036448EA|nr:GLPGLI family protein [Riemerella columbina]
MSQEEISNTIMGYPVMKATADFGGRLWTAYYTPDIPINDGPYKFYGLPGLILKIHDSTNDYNYEIKAVSKENHDISERNFGGSPIATLSPEKWEEFWEKYKAQPSIVLENLGNKQVTYVIDGESVAKKSVKDKYNKKEWKRLKNFENPIELTRGCK